MTIKKILSSHISVETGALEVIVIGWTDSDVVEEHLARYLIAQKLARGYVLDVASGTGYGSSILSRSASVKYVVSIDLDFDLLKYGKSVFGIEAVQADALNLPFPAKVFDTVVSFETIEHLDNPVRFLEQLATVLNDNGLLILSTPNKLYNSPFVKKPLNPYHKSEFYLGEVLKLLDHAGFHVLAVLCGKPINVATLLRRIVGTLIKSLMRSLGIKPRVIDNLYVRTSSSTSTIIKCQNSCIDPSPQRIVHKFIKSNSNIVLCEYFVIIAKKCGNN